MSAPTAVAVVSWNTRALLQRCLRSLEANAEAGLVEVWVVDNASTDGSQDLVRSLGFAHLIASEENLGFGAAVNLVAQRTSTPWIAPANADIELTPGALERMMEAGRRRPAAGAVASRLVLPNGSTQHSVYPFPTVPAMALYNSGLPTLLPLLGDRLAVHGRWNPNRPRWVDWAVGAFLIVRRTAWEQVGGFDPAIWMYTEDLDLGWRLRGAGWRTWYEPAAIVRHHESAATAHAWGDERHERRMRASYEWLLRRRGRALASATAALNVGGAVSRALIAEARAGRRASHEDWRRGKWRSARAHAQGLRLTALSPKPVNNRP